MAILRAAAVPVVGTARVTGRAAMVLLAARGRQPSLAAEARAAFRQGREDFLFLL